MTTIKAMTPTERRMMQRAYSKAQAKADKHNHALSKRLHLRMDAPENAEAMRQVFGSITDAMISIKQSGHVDTVQGTATFSQAGSEYPFEIAPSLRGLVDLSTVIARRYGTEVDTAPLERLASKFDYSMPLTEADLDDAIKALGEIRAQVAPLTAEQAGAASNSAKLLFEFQKHS